MSAVERCALGGGCPCYSRWRGEALQRAGGSHGGRLQGEPGGPAPREGPGGCFQVCETALQGVALPSPPSQPRGVAAGLSLHSQCVLLGRGGPQNHPHPGRGWKLGRTPSPGPSQARDATAAVPAHICCLHLSSRERTGCLVSEHEAAVNYARPGWPLVLGNRKVRLLSKALRDGGRGTGAGRLPCRARSLLSSTQDVSTSKPP